MVGGDLRHNQATHPHTHASDARKRAQWWCRRVCVQIIVLCFKSSVFLLIICYQPLGHFKRSLLCANQGCCSESLVGQKGGGQRVGVAGSEFANSFSARRERRKSIYRNFAPESYFKTILISFVRIRVVRIALPRIACRPFRRRRRSRSRTPTRSS